VKPPFTRAFHHLSFTGNFASASSSFLLNASSQSCCCWWRRPASSTLILVVVIDCATSSFAISWFTIALTRLIAIGSHRRRPGIRPIRRTGRPAALRARLSAYQRCEPSRSLRKCSGSRGPCRPGDSPP